MGRQLSTSFLKTFFFFVTHFLIHGLLSFLPGIISIHFGLMFSLSSSTYMTRRGASSAPGTRTFLAPPPPASLVQSAPINRRQASVRAPEGQTDSVLNDRAPCSGAVAPCAVLPCPACISRPVVRSPPCPVCCAAAILFLCRPIIVGRNAHPSMWEERQRLVIQPGLVHSCVVCFSSFQIKCS